MTLLKIYRKKFYLFFFILFTGHSCLSQDFFASVFAGIANYSGDLQQKRFSFQQAHPAFGVGLLYELNEKMLIRADFTYGRISAHDKYSSKNYARNLSFLSNISEYSIGFEYTFLDLYVNKVSPYLYTGIALYDFNPYTKLENNNLIYLAELNTEGQGFYEGRKEYKLRQFSIPMGAGFQWAFSDHKRLGIVLGFRKTFTDYLDDVSTTYVDQPTLVLNRSQTSATYAYRGDELDNGPAYPPGGTPRGNPKSKDWYYFVGITFRTRLLPKRKEIRFQFNPKSARKNSRKCPAVY